MNLPEYMARYRRYRLIPLLLAIFLLGFAIRYLAAGPRIGPELDTWFHYRMVNYILELGRIPDIDPLAYYPTGRAVWEIDNLGLPTFIAYTYMLIRSTGITVMDYMVAFPAIVTSLAAIPLFFLGKELFNERIGLLSAVFWQIIPSTLTRTHAGFVDKETLSSVYIFIWLWLFIRSLKTFDIEDRRTILTPILAGVFLGFSAWTWGGTAYFVMALSAAILLYTLLNLKNLIEIGENMGYTLILMTLAAALTMKVVQPPLFPFSLFLDIKGLTYAAFTKLSLLYIFVILYRPLSNRMGREKAKNYVIGGLGILFTAGLLTGAMQKIVTEVLKFIKFRLFLEKELVASTVSENLSPSLFCGGGSPLNQILRCDWYAHFNITLFLAPIGILFLLLRFREKRDFASLFTLVFILSGILGMRSDIRLGFALTPSIALTSSYAIFYILDKLQKREEELEETLKHSKKQKIRYQAETRLSNTRLTALLVLIILIGGVAAPAKAGFSMLNGRKVDVPAPWYNAMIWIRDNTPEDAVIVSWWDYGYWEQALAKRRTVVDGGNVGPRVHNTNYTEGLEYRGSDYGRNVDMARMFTSPEDEALKYLRPYVDYEKVPTYVIVSYEEFGKSSAINHISQGGGLYIIPQGFAKSGDQAKDGQLIADFINNNGIEAYTVINLPSYWQIWITGFDPNTGLSVPGMKDKLLAKLLPFENTGFGRGLKHFELVYKDEINYVLIYRVVV